jgi:hypothetical protein
LSRIFDALKRAQQSSGSSREAGALPVERRRSARWSAHVPVFVYGHTPGLTPFHEEAYSTNVSALGARLVMMATVRPGQTLLLTNKMTQAEQECQVAYVAGHDPQTVQVAVEFPKLAPDFWRLTNPPEENKAPAPPSGSGKRRPREPKPGK